MNNIIHIFKKQFRRRVWDEAGQMAAAFGNQYCGYYAYDAQGNRAYKLTGTVVEDQYNGGYPSYTAYFDDVVLYVNPYMVVTPRGYTKHYYNGSQRIASRLGDYWNQDNTLIVADVAISRADTLCRNTVSVTESPFQDMEGDEQYIRTDGTYLPIVSYGPYISSIRGVFAEDLLWDVLHSNCREEEDITDEGIFYYHPDHLGSSSWITSDRGLAVQYIHYMPYGELWVNQQASQYDERFKFTGKERDTETGYDYFGARYYCSTFDHWTSPDLLSDEQPHITPYAYCNWNPVKNVDPDGNFPWVAIAGAALDYGLQVYDNYQNGATGYDAWVGDVNFIEVGLSAINPMGKFAIAKIALIEGAKALTDGSSVRKGIQINTDIQDIVEQTVTNTIAGATIGKVVDAGSEKALKKVGDEVSNATQQLRTAERRMQRSPNSTNATNNLKSAQCKVQATRKKQVRAQMLHSTIGQSPDASNLLLNSIREQATKKVNNDSQ